MIECGGLQGKNDRRNRLDNVSPHDSVARRWLRLEKHERRISCVVSSKQKKRKTRSRGLVAPPAPCSRRFASRRAAERWHTIDELGLALASFSASVFELVLPAGEPPNYFFKHDVRDV